MSKELDRIQRAIETAALSPRDWQGVLDTVSAVVPGLRCSLFGHDTRTAAPFMLCHSGYDQEFIHAFLNETYGESPWAKGFNAVDAGKIVRADALCPEETILGTDFYEHWVRPQEDIYAGAGSVLFRDAGRVFLLAGNLRRKDQDTVEDQWVDLLDRITPRICHALEVNRAIVTAQLPLAVGGSGPFEGTVLLDMSRRVAFADRGAERMIETGSVLGTSGGGRMRFRDPKAQEWLDGLIAGLRSSARSLSSSHLLGGAASRVTLLCRSFRVQDVVELPEGTSIALNLDQPHLGLVFSRRCLTRAHAEQLTTSLNLTQAEAEIALSLADYMSLDEIAADRGRSLTTVRNQIKAIYRKCHVRSQAELVRLVMDVVMV